MSEILTREPASEPLNDLARPIILADLVEELVADAEETVRAAAAGEVRGPITGIEDLDDTLGYCLAPGLHVSTGDPGAGKTALALQIAARCQTPALFITAEQAPLELFRRHVARETGTSLKDLRRAAPRVVRDLAARAAAAAPKLAFLDATVRPAMPGQIEGIAIGLRERFRCPHVLLVLDALQPWARGLGAGNEYDLIQAGIGEMRSLTATLRAPAMILAHRNRASAGDRTAGLTAAKGSADFEHMAETVLHLSAGKTNEEDASRPEKSVSIHIAKNRRGPMGFTLDLLFNGATQLFTGTGGGAYVPKPAQRSKGGRGFAGFDQ